MITSNPTNGTAQTSARTRPNNSSWPVSVLLDIQDLDLEQIVVDTLQTKPELFVWTSKNSPQKSQNGGQASPDPRNYAVVLADRFDNLSDFGRRQQRIPGTLIHVRPAHLENRLDLNFWSNARLDRQFIKNRLIDYLIIAAEDMMALPEHLLHPEIRKWCATLARVPALSQPEILILKSLGLGDSNEEASVRLNKPVPTIKSLVRRVLQKLEFENRTQVAVFVASMTTYYLRLKSEARAYRGYH